MPKKIERGDPLVSSGFVGYVKIVKNERGDPFALISADLTRPYGSSFSSFDCKKSGPIRVMVVWQKKKKLATVSINYKYWRKIKTKTTWYL